MAQVAFSGRSNVGKSSLVNRLLGEERYTALLREKELLGFGARELRERPDAAALSPHRGRDDSRADPDGLRLGAAVPSCRITEDKMMQDKYPGLTEAAGRPAQAIGSPSPVPPLSRVRLVETR